MLTQTSTHESQHVELAQREAGTGSRLLSFMSVVVLYPVVLAAIMGLCAWLFI